MNQIEMSDDFRKMFEDLAKYGILRHDEDKPLYKYVSIDTAKKIIGNGTIKFSTPHELNDNDLDTSLLNPTVSEAEKIKITQEIIKKHSDLHPELNQYIDPEYGAFKLQQIFTDLDFNLATLQGYEAQKKSVGIFCSTTNKTNKYMWEKYAESHTGVCLEFRFPTLFNKIFYTFTVTYDFEFNSGMLFNKDGSVNSLTINRWLFTKSKKYDIENEVRIITENSIGICPFPKKLLTGVIYGRDISDKDVFEIDELLARGGYLFKQGERVEN